MTFLSGLDEKHPKQVNAYGTSVLGRLRNGSPARDG
jgi:hypothetical protein